MAKRGFENREISAAVEERRSLGNHRLEIERYFNRVLCAVDLLRDITDLVASRESRLHLRGNDTELFVMLFKMQLFRALPGRD